MHTCPFCGEECDCDMDGTGGLPMPDDCPHVCAEPENNDDWDDFDRDDFDEVPE